MPKSILIVDDDKRVRNVLRSFVESRTHFDVCGEAVNGIDAIEKARTLKSRFDRDGLLDASHEWN